MEACYGGTDVMERSCAVARGIDINNTPDTGAGVWMCSFSPVLADDIVLYSK
jgi:hypothetical protein